MLMHFVYFGVILVSFRVMLTALLGRVVAAMEQGGLWENALVVLHADNGGEIMGAGTCGGNNW